MSIFSTARIRDTVGGGAAGVTSLNGLTGVVTLSAGANITLTPVGNDIEIASSGGGTPSAPDTSIQYNTSNAFDGDAEFTRVAATSLTTIQRTSSVGATEGFYLENFGGSAPVARVGYADATGSSRVVVGDASSLGLGNHAVNINSTLSATSETSITLLPNSGGIVYDDSIGGGTTTNTISVGSATIDVTAVTGGVGTSVSLTTPSGLQVVGANTGGTNPAIRVAGSDLVTKFEVRNNGHILNGSGGVGSAISAWQPNTNSVVYAVRTNPDTGIRNTLVGHQAGNDFIVGATSTMIGEQAGLVQVSGERNVFVGTGVVRDGAVTNLSRITAVGASALEDTEVNDSTALGFQAGQTNTTGTSNTFLGNQAGQANVTGSENVLIGHQAGQLGSASNSVFVGNSAGLNNLATGTVGVGHNALAGNSSGERNTAIGASAGFTVSTSSDNFFGGYNAGINATGGFNTILGSLAADAASFSGQSNVYLGYEAASSATTGSANVIIGAEAGENITDVEQLVIIGYQAGQNITPGASRNGAVVIGWNAAKALTNGSNVFIGWQAGLQATPDSSVVIGYNAVSGAVFTGSGTVVIGSSALNGGTNANNGVYIGNASGNTITTGDNNTFIGASTDGAAGTTTNSIALGYQATASANNQFMLGASTSALSNAYINGTTMASPLNFTWNLAGASGTNVAGAHWTWAASRSTGNGLGGSHIWQVSPAGASGTSLNTLVNAFEIDGTTRSIFYGHIKSQQTTAPTTDLTGTTLNDGGGTGAAATITAGGTDSAGTITITAGNGTPGAGKAARIVFNAAYGATPKSVQLTPADADGADNQWYVTNISTTGFDVNFAVALGTSEQVIFTYWVIE